MAQHNSHGPMNYQGKHVLIVSVHYWPEETGSGPYATGSAEYFASRGARVTVLTAMPFFPEWKIRDPYRRAWSRTEHHNGVEIRRVRHYIPKAQSALKRIMYEMSFLGCLLRVPWNNRPDVIIGFIPSLSGGIAARLVSRLLRAPYGLNVQDLSGQAARQSGIAGGSAVARLTTALEGVICRGAMRLTIVSPAFEPPLLAMGVRPGAIATLRNWSHISEPTGDRDQRRRELGWRPDEFIVLHAGNMGLKQGLEHLIDAATIIGAQRPFVRFVLLGDGNQREILARRARELRNLVFMSSVDSRTLPNILAAADVLLVHERASVMDMSLPSKLTSYFMAGQPVLAAVNPDGATAQELGRTRAAVVVPAENPSALLRAIIQLHDDPALRGTLAKRGRAYARDHLSAESAKSALDAFVHHLVDEPGLSARQRGALGP